jgi:hypothetical protein
MVAALQKQRISGDGTRYTRLPPVELAIEVFSVLPMGEFVNRARITNRSDPYYVPSECLLHVFRNAARHQTLSPELEELFVTLRQRILRALPPIERYASGDKRPFESASATEIQEAVLFRFQELLCQDRLNYEEKLDFFEIRFDQAVARLRLTAGKKVRNREDRAMPLTEEDTNESSHQVETALARLREHPVEILEAADYRRSLVAAINALPDDERRVIELWLQDVPIDSQDPNTVTMASVLKCSEKTVRNRRDRAFMKLRAFFGVKGSPE